ITTPRDPGYDVDPVFDLGGPIIRDRVWFFAGYSPQVNRNERTVRFRSNGQTQTFENNAETHLLNYNASSQLTANTRLRFAGSNIRGYGGSTLPGKEPDGTSNSNPSLFPNPLHTNTTNDSYIGELSWIA